MLLLLLVPAAYASVSLQRTRQVPAETRTVSVAAENRTIAVAAEDRTIRIPTSE